MHRAGKSSKEEECSSPFIGPCLLCSADPYRSSQREPGEAACWISPEASVLPPPSSSPAPLFGENRKSQASLGNPGFLSRRHCPFRTASLPRLLILPVLTSGSGRVGDAHHPVHPLCGGNSCPMAGWREDRCAFCSDGTPAFLPVPWRPWH